MNILEKRILEEGRVLGDEVLKVDSFLNHQIDAELLYEVGREFHRRFKDAGINKILTIEASGIAVASMTALFFHVPVVYAKKSDSVNVSKDRYRTEVFSFTHKKSFDVSVSKSFLKAGDHVLLVDDFLAEGCALRGLSDLVRQSGGEVVGAAIAIEKGFQKGGSSLRNEGLRIESMAIVDALDTQNGCVHLRGGVEKE